MALKFCNFHKDGADLYLKGCPLCSEDAESVPSSLLDRVACATVDAENSSAHSRRASVGETRIEHTIPYSEPVTQPSEEPLEPKSVSAVR